MSGTYPLLKLAPSYDLEKNIKRMRRCGYKCPMVACLDERVERQRLLIRQVLSEKGYDYQEFKKLSLKDIDVSDSLLVFIWHVLNDLEYIDSLR